MVCKHVPIGYSNTDVDQESRKNALWHEALNQVFSAVIANQKSPVTIQLALAKCINLFFKNLKIACKAQHHALIEAQVEAL